MLCSTIMSELLSSLLVFVLILLSVGHTTDGEKNVYFGDLTRTSAITSAWDGTTRNVWAVKGSSVVLRCAFVARTTLQKYTVTWYKNNQKINSRRLVQTTSGHLNITRVRRKGRSGTERDDGQYHCAVSFLSQRNISLASPPIQLKVAEIGRNIKSSASNTSVHEGESLRLKCQISSQPPASITWQKESTPLPLDGRMAVLTSGVLQIANVQKGDSGIYKCSARNELLNKSREYSGIQVNVLPPPTTYFHPKFLSPRPTTPQVALPHQDVVIECLATGYPLPTMKWFKKVSDSGNEDDYVPIALIAGKVELVGYSNLRLLLVTTKDSGIYRCQAHSVNKDLKDHFSNTQETQLEVVAAPMPITVLPINNMTTLIGKTSRLDCSVAGNNQSHLPQIQWYKDGRLFEPDSRVKLSGPKQIIIINTLTAHAGIYQCLAVNKAGFSTSWTYLSVNTSSAQPAAPRNLRVRVDSATSVQLNWDHPSADTVRAFSIHYAEQNGCEKQCEEKSEVADYNSFHLTKLKPFTKYSVEVRAYNNEISEFSEKKFFTTLEDVPPVVPEFQLKATSPTTMAVKWKRLGALEARGQIVGYKIMWRRRSKSDSFNVDEVNENTLSHNITSLHPGKIYKVLVLAGTKAGYPNINHWSWRTITMPELVPMSPIVTLEASSDDANGDKTAIKINWRLPKDNVIEVDGYQLRFKSIKMDWSDILEFPSSTTSYTIPGLKPGKYQVKMWAYNHEGDSTATSQIIDTANLSGEIVIEKENLRISNVEISLDSVTVAHLSWNVDESMKQFIKFYMIKQVNIENVFVGEPLEDDVFMKSTTNSIVIDSLTPGSNYVFSIRAHVSEDNYGSYSQPVALHETTVATPAPVAVVPQVKTSDPLDPSTIKLEWTFNDARPDKFVIAYSDNASLPLDLWHTKDFSGTSKQGKIGGLISNKLYWFKIAACTDKSCGEYSKDLTGMIPAVLSNNSLLWLVVVLVMLVIAACIVFCLVKYMSKVTTRSINCNGNGSLRMRHKHMDPTKLNTSNHISSRENGTESNGIDGDYIPMINRVHSDVPETQLDTKGGYPTKVNGFTNPRINGIIKPKDHFVSRKMEDQEERERLFPVVATTPTGVPRSIPTEDVPVKGTDMAGSKVTKASSYAVGPNSYLATESGGSGSANFDTSCHKSDHWSHSAKNPLLRNCSSSAMSESSSVVP